MPRAVPAVEHAIEVQVALTDLRRACGPLWQSAIASGDWTLISQCQALSVTLSTVSLQLRRLSGRADSIACPDGCAQHGHGRAA